MKIIRVFGVVVGIHLFALMLIFANPGCSSTSKPAPAPADTVAAAPAPSAPVVSVPITASTGPSSTGSALSAAPISFDPSAPAVASVRYTPTRPGTPAASALEAAPIADVTPATTYTVGKGDNLWELAKKNHLSVGDLAAANNIKAGTALRPGQKLIIPGKPTAAMAATATAAPASGTAATPVKPVAGSPAAKPSGEAIQHTVKPGETLGAIAQKYGVKQRDIGVANNITDPKLIRPGQILTIPGSQSSATKSKTPAKTADSAAKPAAAPEATKPLFVIPPIEQDLDSGLKPAPASDVPVIKVEEAPLPKKS